MYSQVHLQDTSDLLMEALHSESSSCCDASLSAQSRHLSVCPYICLSVCRCSLWFLGVRFSSPLWLSCSDASSVLRRRTGQNLEEEVVHPHRQLPLLLRVHHGEYRSGCHGNPATPSALSRCSRIYPGQRAQGDHPTGEPEHQRGGG